MSARDERDTAIWNVCRSDFPASPGAARSHDAAMSGRARATSGRQAAVRRSSDGDGRFWIDRHDVRRRRTSPAICSPTKCHPVRRQADHHQGRHSLGNRAHHRRPGRPSIQRTARDLALEMARDDPAWGYRTHPRRTHRPRLPARVLDCTEDSPRRRHPQVEDPAACRPGSCAGSGSLDVDCHCRQPRTVYRRASVGRPSTTPRGEVRARFRPCCGWGLSGR